MKHSLIAFSLHYPKRVFGIMAIITLVILSFATHRVIQSPTGIIDTDPENMLDKTERIRTFHNQMKTTFGLHDIVAMGIYHPGKHGAYTPEILSATNKITNELLSLKTTPFLISTNGDTLHASEIVAGINFNDIIAFNQIEDINGETGTLVIQPLMKEAPKLQEGADRIQQRVASNPLFHNKIASEDGKLIGIYIPIYTKSVSAKLAEALEVLAKKHLSPVLVDGQPFFGAPNTPTGEYLIAGLPVAQDVFGKFMFDQMGVAGPLAGLVIFILLFVFFRNTKIISAPMIMAMVTIIWTMGLLVATGFTLHIMSSMIPIFLFPIAVLDSIHIISSVHKKHHKAARIHQTLKSTISELFGPMLFTSITTVVGFASLMLTPIPPVQVFGIFVAFGVFTAWLLSVTFLPAYLGQLKPTTFDSFGNRNTKNNFLDKVQNTLHQISKKYYAFVLTASCILLTISAIGISEIEINDNPVKWFKEGHSLRHASELMNRHVSGTYLANIVFTFNPNKQGTDSNQISEALLHEMIGKNEIHTAFTHTSQGEIWGTLSNGKPYHAKLDIQPTPFISSLNPIESNEFNEDAFDEVSLSEIVRVKPLYMFDDILFGNKNGAKLFSIVDSDAISELKLAHIFSHSHIPVIDVHEPLKSPEILRYMERVQEVAEGDKRIVGGTSSVLDIIKKVNMELHDADKNFARIPETKKEVGQYLFLAQGGESPEDLYKFITRGFNSAHLWLHLNTGDNQNMSAVIERVQQFVQANPLPLGLEMEWAGLNYINTVWQDKMVGGMRDSLIGSFIIVFIMISLLFRSIKWGFIGMIPITLTVSMIYAFIGFIGKPYDMPIAVLSSLTLGLSIDFGIHFIGRAKDIFQQTHSFKQTMNEIFGEPATAMLQNMIVVSIGFIPLIFSDLVPYITVGSFFFAIMLVSGIATLTILPSVSYRFKGSLFKETERIEQTKHEPTHV